MPIMRIKERRTAAGLSQVELATQMGMVQSAIGNWETEIALPKARDLPRLARVLGCTINDLFAAEDPEDPKEYDTTEEE